ncbi:hypothetical protein SDC49_06885 [Lactobacillus sp. R2/2]|nr:hypothetical protein [Lactobacillus sp. R2/2]
MSESAHLLKKIIDEYLNYDLFTRNAIMAELTLLFVSAVRNQNLTSTPAISHQFAQTDLEKYIDAHFTNITLNDAAKHFGFNPNYFSSLVKQKLAKVLWNMSMKGACWKHEVYLPAQIFPSKR